MTVDNLIIILTPILPTLFLILGGQLILNRYEQRRKSKEQEIELIRSVREKRYEAVESLYHLFSVFMTLYREANSPDTDLSNPEIKKDLLKRAIQAESELDALILRIGCEFTHRSETSLEDLRSEEHTSE